VDEQPADGPEVETVTPEYEYGDGVRVNEQGEKVIELGTLNKTKKATKKSKINGD
jgi:hypothetical protein